MAISYEAYNLIVRVRGAYWANLAAFQSGGVADADGRNHMNVANPGPAPVVIEPVVNPPMATTNPPTAPPLPDFSDTFPVGGDFYGDGFSTPRPTVVEDPGPLTIDPGQVGTIGGSIGALPGVGAIVAPVAAGSLALVWTLLRQTGFRGGRLLANQWGALPTWAQTALGVIGITVGSEIAADLIGIDDTGLIPGFGLPDGGSMPTSVPGVMIIGSWNANGVRFYRLSDGKLAVQRKNGSWKVWRPKKPIVLYAGGAGNLRTMMRAEKALDTQAKKIRKFINKRAPQRRSPRPSSGGGQTVRNINVDN